MQSFTLHYAILQDLDKTSSNFFWNEDLGCGASNLIGWNSICRPKCAGGHSSRKVKVTNLAYQLKLFLKVIANPNHL